MGHVRPVNGKPNIYILSPAPRAWVSAAQKLISG